MKLVFYWPRHADTWYLPPRWTAVRATRYDLRQIAAGGNALASAQNLNRLCYPICILFLCYAGLKPHDQAVASGNGTYLAMTYPLGDKSSVVNQSRTILPDCEYRSMNFRPKGKT